VIVLDTNVLSELMKPAPDGRVVAWVNAQSESSLFTTFVSEAEIRFGVALLPDGARKESLRQAVTGLFGQDLCGRVLPFDGSAARAYADIAANRRRLGRPISQFDALIAAIARSRGAAVATRNSDDFDDFGLTVIDPWS